MKLFELRLYKMKVMKDSEVLFEGMAEELPEELKTMESKTIKLENGEAVIQI